MTTTAAPAGPRGLRRAILDGWVMTWRNLMHTIRMPELLVFTIVQPVMFVVLFAFVFGGAIPVPGTNYREFLMAGIFTQTVAFAGAATAVGLAEDLHKGLVDRFRSLPVARSAVLVGRTVGDTARNLLIIVIMVVCGLLVGWRTHNGVFEVAAGFALLVLLGFALSWIGSWIGLAAPSPEVANTAGLIWLFPLTFLSNAFVPPDTLPGWLQPVADWNPISAVVAACRELFGNPNPIESTAFPMQHPVLVSVAWVVLILAVFGPLAVRKYRRATTH